eukprot:1787061-Rhodomonas_salina.2
MRAVFFAALLKLLSLEKGLAGPAFHPAAGLITAAVSPPFRGIAQARAEFKLALLGRVKLLPHLKTFLPGCSCSNLLRPSTSKRKSALVRSLSIGPTEVDNPGAAASLSSYFVKGCDDGGGREGVKTTKVE